MKNQVVIQAGGKGKRLRPHTYVLPKPLMPLGDSTLLETNIKWLCKNGIVNQIITLGYLGHLISAIIDDGSQFGSKISYFTEKKPLGTAGSLVNLVDDLDEDFILMNGDLVVDLDIDKFKATHIENNYDITVGAFTTQHQVDYGVLALDERKLLKTFDEKPEIDTLVAMGVYYINKDVISLIPSGSPFGMDNLINQVIKDGGRVGIFHHQGIWLDIGRLQELSNIQEEYSKIESILLGI
jgi:mannose-1-phosphate guanylyltransferase|tara:strand:+ start:335 stop:1051 length:717 start_codon:yes stop_codon:yes gene_type:complete